MQVFTSSTASVSKWPFTVRDNSRFNIGITAVDTNRFSFVVEVSGFLDGSQTPYRLDTPPLAQTGQPFQPI